MCVCVAVGTFKVVRFYDMWSETGNSILFSFVALKLPSVLWRCWLGGRKGIRPVKKVEWWGTGMVLCLAQFADLHIAQLMPLPLTVSLKSRLVLPFWYQLTQIVPEKGPLNGCVCVLLPKNMKCTLVIYFENRFLCVVLVLIFMLCADSRVC